MEFFIPGFISLLLTLISIPFTIHFAKKYSLLDNPKLRPHPAHIQNRIVPRAGGLACFIGIIISTLFFLSAEKYIFGIIGSLSILLIIGLLDDKYKNFSPYYRLLGQFVAALIIVSSGVGIKFITNPFGGIIHLDTIIIPLNILGSHYIVLFADILALIWIVWVMNMINWSKGVDGQMPGIVTVAAFFLGILSVKLSMTGDEEQIKVAILSFITAGASLGLLIFNWYPAKIFPGFSGSTILGFMIAILSILSGAKLATAGLVLLIPATDFAYTFVRRILQGRSPVWGDRGHLHHKLLEKGFTHRQISLFYILLGVILGSIALNLNSQGKLFAAGLITVLSLGFILWLNFFGGLSKQSGQDSG